MRKAVPVLLVCLLLLPPAAAAADVQADRLHAYLRQGIECAFNLDHSGATAAFQKAVELDPEGPTGYAFLALARLFSYEMGFDPRSDRSVRRRCSDTSARR